MTNLLKSMVITSAFFGVFSQHVVANPTRIDSLPKIASHRELTAQTSGVKNSELTVTNDQIAAFFRELEKYYAADRKNHLLPADCPPQLFDTSRLSYDGAIIYLYRQRSFTLTHWGGNHETEISDFLRRHGITINEKIPDQAILKILSAS